MLWLILIAQAISILCITLHYRQHFKCRKRTNALNSSFTSSTTSPNSSPRRKRTGSIFFADLRHRTFQTPKRCCKGCFRSIDGEEFDLFPISFLVYLVFTFIIITLVTINEFYSSNYILNYSQNRLYLLITTKYNGWKQQTSISTNSHKYIHNYPIDYVISYLILILFIFESSFHYHRYYITQYASKHFFNPSFTSEIKHFSVYAFAFLFLFLLQIHVYYWLFPLVTLLHCIFNVYCTWTFCSILVERYKFYKNTEDGLEKIHQQLLETVYTIRKTSIASVVLSSVSIFVFCIVYNIHIICYIGLLWNAANITFMFNFVRIRLWIYSNLLCICIPKNINKLDNNNDTKTKDTKNLSLAIHVGEHTTAPNTSGTNTSNTLNTSKLTPSKLTPSTCTVDVTPITETDVSPVTDNDIIINSDDDAKISSSNQTKKSATMTSNSLLNVPTPMPIKTTCINNNKPDNDKDDTEYQKWYLNQHTTTSEPNSPNNVKKNSLLIPSLKITIKRKFQLNDAENIDKTPLNDNVELAAYDMTPIGTINDNDEKLDMKLIMQMDNSESEVSEPSVQDINAGNKTPINDMFIGILKKASSLVKSYSNDANKKRSPKLQQRGRSHSDPIKYNTNINVTAPNVENVTTTDQIPTDIAEDNVDHNEHSILSHSVNLIGTQLQQTVPQLVDHYSEPKPNTFGNNIVKFSPNNNNMSFQNDNKDDILMNVLVSHGFCSRSSLKLFK